MKFTTMHTHVFTAEYWDYTTEQGIDGQLTSTYFFDRNLRFSLVSAEKGTMYLFADEQLRYNAQVRELKDSVGNYVFKQALTGEPVLSYVGLSEPVFDVFGTVVGYRHDLSQGV